MPARDQDISEDPPASINPYEVLGISEKATADEVKSAYRKQALKHHPDKAAPDAKEEANKKFQEIAFAYAILSEDRRRRRYDLTGSTSESVEGEDGGEFDWMDFYREQFSSMIDAAAVERFRQEYQGSEEEERDLLAAYERFEGDLDMVYEEVMLSNVLEDDERFREIITQAIRTGEVSDYSKFSKEGKKGRERRKKAAKKEAEEARELAKELGLEEKLFGKGEGKDKKGKGKKAGSGAGGGDEAGLMALIQQRQKGRAGDFFAHLEAKYAGKGAKKGKKRAAADEPPEEAFERNRKTETKSAETKTSSKKRKA
ncbi:hypothetical protein AJ80_07842 [Polytolypa hystricis UAMH7299]|uniref:J domain-containing protein n=1 Tax=Polytolypa hystricis (strain UAMH7299) TaxID=1447883 RepID=A0A2B7XIK3_POLH7|nr:hypothetical protein AJ80_07842 [Polytolypa hystricis UAMH7299]